MTNAVDKKRKRFPGSNTIAIDGEDISLSSGSESIGIDEEFIVENPVNDEDMQAEEIDEDQYEVYLPGQKLGEDEVLVADYSTYEMLHTMTPEWPCLSFDIVKDALGNNRTQFPLSATLVAGSQAASVKENRIYLMKMSRLCRNKRDGADSDLSDDDDDDKMTDPVLAYKAIPHEGGINRIRAFGDSPLVATWSDLGKVHIWDLKGASESLEQSTLYDQISPVYTVSNHKNEGFALDWSPTAPLRLLSGDCQKHIYLTTSSQGSSEFTTDSVPFAGHSGSIEDIQWSPSESEVFASCSSDGTIKIWDIRVKKSSQLTVQASNVDMNVIHWNRSVEYLLAGGDDSGSFGVWDLRSIASNGSDALTNPAAKFSWHKDAITSIEWAPHESSMLAVAGADDQVTLWDLSLEADKDELLVQGSKDNDPAQVPAQLLFVHQGQNFIKEVHWHSQLPGVLISTSMSGFNIFKTINS